MNQGQEQFFSFIMQRVQEGKEEQAKQLLNESFERQADRTFSGEYLQSFIPKMLDMLKSEHIEEVKNIMGKFGEQHTSK